MSSLAPVHSAVAAGAQVSAAGTRVAVPKTAFVLAAGLGSRLRPLTEKTPKPLLPVGGQPMICHMFDRLLEAGIQRFIVNTYHLADAFPAAFPTGEWRGAPIIFARENVRLETGGGLKNIEPLLDDDDHALLVCNGDVFATPDFPALAAAHAAAGTAAPDVTLLLRSTGTPLNVRLRADGVVTDMRHRLGTTDADGSLRLFTGIYCASRSFFNALVAGCAESVVEAFLRRIADAAGSVRGFVDDASDWHDLGSLDEYAAICKRFN